MTPSSRFSHEPTRYDEARVAQVEPVEAAIQRLGLPLLRARKLNAVAKALVMQIEDGGDSPEVNGHLLAALRAGVRHQVDEAQARRVFDAIEAFERAEAVCWQQVASDTLPPIGLSTEDRLDDLMQAGYQLLEQQQAVAACDRWLEAWDLVQQLAEPGWRSVQEFDEAMPLTQLVFNWCQDLEGELANAGLDQPVYHEHRLRYARDFVARFPEHDVLFDINFSRAQGEALWELGRQAEAEAVYAALASRRPDEAWAYIGWADHYWLIHDAPKDYDRAEALFHRALGRPHLNDRPDVFERLLELYTKWGKPVEAAAARRAQASAARAAGPRPPTPVAAVPATASRSVPRPKLSRNGPCWCGSGRKYKRCHLAADEAARR